MPACQVDLCCLDFSEYFDLYLGDKVKYTWRIRLVVYGARLESVLGAIPHEFESHILRHITIIIRFLNKYVSFN
jgi:hypothetical protein